MHGSIHAADLSSINDYQCVCRTIFICRRITLSLSLSLLALLLFEMNDDRSHDVTLHPQLEERHLAYATDSASEDDNANENGAPVAPAANNQDPHMVRVTRPVPPRDYGPQPPLFSIEELMNLAFR